jgi:DNA-binding transcriptional ArsR family regulator
MSLAQTFYALSNETRREILNLLKKGPLTVHQITENFDITISGVSKHLSILKEANLVCFTGVGTFMLYELNTTIFQDILAWVKEFESVVRNVTNKDDYFNIIVNSRI